MALEFLIQPIFEEANGSMFFETKSLNALLEAEYNDKMGFYQTQFGVYSYMTLNQDLEFVIHYPEGTPFLWQPHNNCAWTPTGTLIMNQRTLTPCKAKINEQKCYDEYFNSAYKSWMEWRTNGSVVGFNNGGQMAQDMFTRTIVKNASLGARMTLTAGQLFDLSDAGTEFNDNVGIRIDDAFRKTSLTCKGWIQLCKELGQATETTHLNNDLIRAGDISSDGTTWVGDGGRDIVALYDEYLSDSSTPQALKDAVIEGGVGGFGNVFFPLFLVAQPEYRAVDAAYKAQKTTAMVNEPRIERRPFQYQTERGARTIYVYFIDDTAVIPISEPNHFSQYLTGTAHFAYLTISGVIQLGGSFGDLPVVNQSEVAVLAQMSENAEDYGTMKFLAHSLMATAINDTRYIAGDYVYATPA